MKFKLFGKTLSISKKLAVAVVSAGAIFFNAKQQNIKVDWNNIAGIVMVYLGAQGVADAAANYGSSTPPNPPVVTNPDEPVVPTPVVVAVKPET